MLETKRLNSIHPQVGVLLVVFLFVVLSMIANLGAPFWLPVPLAGLIALGYAKAFSHRPIRGAPHFLPVSALMGLCLALFAPSGAYGSWEADDLMRLWIMIGIGGGVGVSFLYFAFTQALPKSDPPWYATGPTYANLWPWIGAALALGVVLSLAGVAPLGVVWAMAVVCATVPWGRTVRPQYDIPWVRGLIWALFPIFALFSLILIVRAT